MRRFLLSLFFVGALSAVFSFTAFANWNDSVSSPYMGSGQATYNHIVTYNVSASPGDVRYFDVRVVNYGAQVYDASGRQITNVSDDSDFSYSITALGVNYGAADVSTEGQRVWLVFNQSVSSVTVTLQIEYSLAWVSGSTNSGADLTQCVLTSISNASCGSLNRVKSGVPTDQSNSDKLDTANNKLNQILDALGENPGTGSNFLGDEALVYFDQRYFNTPVGGTYNDNGLLNYSGQTTIGFYNDNTPNGSYRTPSIFLSPGKYYLIFNSAGYFDYFYFGYVNSGYTTKLVSSTDGGDNYGWLQVYEVTVTETFSTNSIYFAFKQAVSGVFYGGIVPVPVDDLAGAAVNPDQDGMVSDVDDAGEQQSQQEDQMWQNINTYKGDISFNLDGWDDAAGGLSYVTDVFMTIWNNSPTQPIVLSLMLGIAMLSIGRGVMAAVRVSRNRGDD